MAIIDDFKAAVGLLRGWGFKVVEWSGCYGRSNGLGWASGRPDGHINHHFVCSLNPSQSYIDSLVAGLANGKTVNWFADVHGVAYLIGTGPMNHAGTGNSSVRDLTRQGKPPPGPARSAGDITGNTYYSGTECQHPGDATPWPEPMVDVMVAINAAEFNVWGYTSARAINHYEWTSRKIDMSWLGGPSSGTKAGDELRKRVAAQMGGSTPPTGDWFDNVTKDEMQAMLNATIKPLQDQLNFLYSNEVIEGQPFSKTAANFNDVRALAKDVAHRRIITVYNDVSPIGLALDGPTGVVGLNDPGEAELIGAVIDEDTVANTMQIDAYQQVLGRGVDAFRKD
jgi:hypothetical protein